MRANFVDIYLQGMRDRIMQSGTELALEIKLTDWSMAGNISNWSSGVQIPRDICTRLKRYFYSAKCSWIIKVDNHETFNWLSILLTKMQTNVSIIYEIQVTKPVSTKCRLQTRSVLEFSVFFSGQMELHFFPLRKQNRLNCIISSEFSDVSRPGSGHISG